MSDPVSALQGRTHEGATVIADAGRRGMITLRADLADTKLAAAVKSATGLDLPETRAVVRDGDRALVWMSPDELLILLPHGDVGQMIGQLRSATTGQHCLIADVSDARAVIAMSGPGAREVLAKGAPVDLSQSGFGQGEVRRTRLGQVAVAFWMTGEEAFELVCFRSVAGFVFDWLAHAARDGAEVDFLR